MDKIYITEEMHLEREWFEQAKKIETIDELILFINHLFNDYHHDYGTIVHAIGACAVACAWYGSHISGITGFQASFVMWDFIRYWTKEHNECGLALVDYDNMLYPHYEYYFNTITKDVWEAIQKKARENLRTGEGREDVREHWINIIEGNVPFGYKVRED